MLKKRGKSHRSKIKAGKLESVEVIIRKKLLGEAPEEFHFVLADGKRLKSVLELADALESMSEELFSHHANELKNDFSEWVRGVFFDHHLADEIKKTRSRLETQIAILKRIVTELM